MKDETSQGVDKGAAGTGYLLGVELKKTKQPKSAKPDWLLERDAKAAKVQAKREKKMEEEVRGIWG